MNFKKNSHLSISILIIISFLPACTRLVDWAQCNFYQGISLSDACGDPCLLVRSVTMYDQFETVGHFDALWLSDQVRTAYVDLYIRSLGKNEEQKNILLKRQLDENKHFIIFFVLCPYEMPLGETHSIWNLFLEIDGAHFDPIEIKMVELSPIYRSYFGKHYNRFKAAYQIKFDARDIQDNPLINHNTTQLMLHFRSAHKEGTLCWNTAPVKKEIDMPVIEPCVAPQVIETRDQNARLRKKKGNE